MSDGACPDCGHNLVIHDEHGCMVTTCKCTRAPSPPSGDCS